MLFCYILRYLINIISFKQCNRISYSADNNSCIKRSAEIIADAHLISVSDIFVGCLCGYNNNWKFFQPVLPASPVTPKTIQFWHRDIQKYDRKTKSPSSMISMAFSPSSASTISYSSSSIPVRMSRFISESSTIRILSFSSVSLAFSPCNG